MSNNTTNTTTTIFTQGFYTVERRETEDAIEFIEVCVMPVSGKRREHVTKLHKAMKANYTDEEWKDIEEKVIQIVCNCVPDLETQKKLAANDHKPIVLTREQVRKMGKAVCIHGRWCRDYSGTILANL